MILHLGDDVSVHSADIVAIIDLTQSQNPVTGAMLAEIRRQNRILAKALGHDGFRFLLHLQHGLFLLPAGPMY